MEPGEEPLPAAQRELLEETGYVADDWTDLGRFAVDGNREAGLAHLFLARGAHVGSNPSTPTIWKRTGTAPADPHRIGTSAGPRTDSRYCRGARRSPWPCPTWTAPTTPRHDDAIPERGNGVGRRRRTAGATPPGRRTCAGRFRAGRTSPAYADYDLVIVLAANPLRLHVGVTTIDARLTDLIFVERSHVQAILDAKHPVDPGEWTGRLVAWLQEGTVLFDRHGALAAAQAKVTTTSLLRPLDATDVRPQTGKTHKCGPDYNVC
ncbi:MAG: NUDIX domain-containing protein [Caldilineaceae bacterium]